MKLRSFLLSFVLCALCIGQASALEYTIDAPDDYLFGRPTSDDTIYGWEDPNVDRSKNTALIPPGFGSPTSYLPGSGEYLTPNLVPGALSGGLINQVGSVDTPDGGTTAAISEYPTVSSSTSANGGIAFTEVISSLYYSDGSVGTLEIPAIGLSVHVYEGTDSATLASGVGHFTETSIWTGNVAIAGHNRGVNSYFGSIHTLKAGDRITLTTKLGMRTYSVVSVEKVAETDTSGIAATSANRLTLYTCVRDQSAFRWCVTAMEVAG